MYAKEMEENAAAGNVPKWHAHTYTCTEAWQIARNPVCFSNRYYDTLHSHTVVTKFLLNLTGLFDIGS